MFLDCESKKEWARDSDHFPVWAKIQINKNKKGETETKHPTGNNKILEARKRKVGRIQ